MERSEPEIICGVGPDVPEIKFLRLLNKLRSFSLEFDPKTENDPDNLARLIKNHAKQFAVIIRAVGYIEEVVDQLPKNSISYIPLISTESLRAGLFLNINTVQIGMTDSGFNPLNSTIEGVEIRFQIENSDNPLAQLDIYKYSRPARRINLHAVKSDTKEIAFFANYYKR